MFDDNIDKTRKDLSKGKKKGKKKKKKKKSVNALIKGSRDPKKKGRFLPSCKSCEMLHDD